MSSQYGVVVGIIFATGIYFACSSALSYIKQWANGFKNETDDDRLKPGDFKSGNEDSESDTDSD